MSTAVVDCQATARPSSPIGGTAGTAQHTLAQDRRGYPDRTYSTEVLRVNGDYIRFVGKGKEPVRNVDVDMDDGEQASALERASSALRQGHLVAFPTETVYGLAGNALDADAAGKIFRAKGRPADNPLIVHISDMHMMDSLTPSTFALGPVYQALINTFWPGPLTILVSADAQKVPSVVRCGLDTLGVRMPSHAVARALIARSKLPLAAPSANVSGKPSPTTAQHVYHDMTTRIDGVDEAVGRIPFILDGGSSDVGLESTVVDGITEPSELRILRPGGVSVESIEKLLQKHDLLEHQEHTGMQNGHVGRVRVRVYGRDMAKSADAEMNPTTPGMKYRHYSPEAQVVVLVTGDGAGESVRRLASRSVGEKAARTLLAQGAKDVVAQQVREYRAQTGKQDVRVGLMSMDDSRLTASLLGRSQRDTRSLLWQELQQGDHVLQGFSLGSTTSPEEAAHRLFDGLRTLDQGNETMQGCDLIFVEAVAEDVGVGLAIMNRLDKAASQTILVAV